MKRILTALVGVPAIVLLILFSEKSIYGKWLFASVIALAAAVCLDELFVLGKARLGTRPGRWVLLLGAAAALAFMGGPWWILAVITVSTLLITSVTAFSVSLEEAFPKAALAIFGIIYCGLLPGFLVLLEPRMVIVLLGVVWVGDAAAMYGGKLLGRHPLARSISPKKTVEGAFAGLIGSVVAGVVLGAWLTKAVPEALLMASFVAACAGQIGDLAESALKRSAGVKDSSALLPGHGGLLDRLDSLLFAAPVYYWFFNS